MSKLHSSEEMLRIAGEVAGVLRELQTVVGVGFFGSLARREENPGDIDLVVLTTDQGLTEGLLREAEEGQTYLYPSPGSWRGGMWSLGAGVDLTDKTAAALDREQLHIVILPSVPADEYLNRFEAVQWDSDFLEHAAADYQRYDRESGEFVPARAPWQDYLDSVSEQEAVWPSGDPAFVLSRPYFGRRQVRTCRGIKRGLILADQGGAKIVVLTAVYKRGDDDVFDYAFLAEPPRRCGVNRAYCTDRSVVPYEDRRWNAANHLLRTGRRLTEEEIRAIEVAVS